MKRKNLGFFTLCAASLLMFSCSEEEAVNNQLNSDAAEVSFAFNVADLTKGLHIEENNEGFCKDIPELLELARERKLTANLTINGVQYHLPILGLATQECEDEKIEKLQTTAQVFPLTDCCYTIQAATITGIEDGCPVVYYSGVANCENKYQNYVADEYKMGNQEFCITKHQKATFDLYVLCAEKKDPADFGFAKWNTHFSRSFMLPIFVNYCNYSEGDYQPKGIIDVDYGIKTCEDDPEYNELHRGLSFAYDGERFGEIRFKDDADIDDAKEMHIFTLTLPEEGVVLKSRPISTEELKQIETAEGRFEEYGWNDIMKAIHIDFCKCEYGFFQTTKFVDVIEADKAIWGLTKSLISSQNWNTIINKVTSLNIPIYYGDLAPNINGKYTFEISEFWGFGSDNLSGKKQVMTMEIERAGIVDENGKVCDKVTIYYKDGLDNSKPNMPNPETPDGSYTFTGCIKGSCDDFTIDACTFIHCMNSFYHITLSGNKENGGIKNIKFVDGLITNNVPKALTGFAIQYSDPNIVIMPE